MKILYIFGNGFDINLGLKTRYIDFYEYYMSIDHKTELIRKLKNEISEGITTWADLELALGDYTKNINTQEEFEEIYYDIADNLGDYLEKKEKEFDFEKASIDVFFECLCFPELFLSQRDINELRSFNTQWNKNQWDVNIITLNYTRSIEKILGDRKIDFRIGIHNGYEILIKGLQHIHGYTDDRMIMGVNDMSQISNVNFHKNEEITDALIKANCNMVQRHTIDDLCVNQISKSNLICIFGSSIGDTDNNWWELIGEQLKKDNSTRLIIFSKGDEIKQRFGQKKVVQQKIIKNLFLSKTALNDEEKKSVINNIYVGVNTDIFNLVPVSASVQLVPTN